MSRVWCRRALEGVASWVVFVTWNDPFTTRGDET